jgi:CubicO group peptidase (beta-lactamase class C family)
MKSTFTVCKIVSRKGESIKKRIVLILLLCIHFSGFAQKLYFPPVNSDEWQALSPQSLHWNQAQIDSLYNYLEQGNTKAFLLLKDGKIVLEKYFGDHDKDKLWYWASAGKSLTAFLIGIAQQDKHLSITDPTSKYLGEGWTSTIPEQESKITVWSQLTMTSGLNDANNYCTVDSCLTYVAEVGTRWAYHNAPYTLLDNVLQKATGSTLTDFVQLKLKDKTGITGAYYPVGYNRIFHSTARVMARYGLLILNKGNWNGNRIMTDTDFFNQMVNSSQPVNKSYGYLWWLNGKTSYMQPLSQKVFEGALIPNAPADMIAALGMNGQIMHVVPSRNIVVIRMGDAPGIKEIAGASSSLSYKIWEFINRFEKQE